MSLKSYLESHPLFLILGVGVAVATSTAGVVEYFLDKIHQTKLARIQTEHVIQISRLQDKLASIERKISDDTSFFDVTSWFLSATRIRTLNQSFKTMDGGQFFISEPNMSNWTYALSSELDLLKASIGFDDDEGFPLNVPISELERKNLHLWRNQETLAFQTTPDARGEEGTKFTFFPYVAVQFITVSDLLAIATEFHSALISDSELSELNKSLDALLEHLDSLNMQLHQDSSDASPARQSLTAIQDAAANNPTPGEARLEVEGVLSELFRGDLAAFFLASISTQIVQIPALLPGAKSTLQTVQKKGNVLYMQFTIKFQDIEFLDGNAGSYAAVDQELFVVTNADGVFFIKVQVPSTDGRSDAYSWVGEWLSGFRIPL